jgi:putative oxygen-independent coproporphyrinogen III oxidase
MTVPGVSISPPAPSSGPRFKLLPPLSLYVHVPWCLRKCPYCDFNSHELRGELQEREYVAALLADLEQSLPLVWGRPVYTVFIGGGTPSLLSPEAVETLLSGVRSRLPLAVDAEVTLEANPGTFEAGRFRGFRAAGVNRLSIGVQSFNARHLAALGRVHDDEQAHAAVECAGAVFDNYNLDLMYALPGQTAEDAQADMAQALSYAPPHLSAYHLTLEPNTYFHRYPPKLPDDDAAAAIQEALEAALAGRGYAHYETSAFARPGRKSRHNMNYWTFGDYVGIGAGAHGKISFPDRIVRYMRYRQPREYQERALAGDAVHEQHEVARRELGFEFMMNALRLTEGVPVALYEERTGRPITDIARELDEAERRGLLERDHARLAPTALGRRFLNDLLQVFLPA